MAPGVYLVEATTVGGRGRGPADFTISISRVTGCEPVPIGTLGPGVDLTATGSWTLDTCGSRFVVEHPAHSYIFNLPAGVYLIEATTYLERDLQPLRSDFTLVIQLVDEEAERRSFQLKVEATHAPDQVIAGVPFPVHYRVGNLGGGDLIETHGSVEVYLPAGPVIPSEGRWSAGVSYHSGPQTASATSIENGEVTPFSITHRRSGPSWVFLAIIAFDESVEEVGFHGIWRNLEVLSGLTFDPVTVRVDDMDYKVSTEVDADGLVTVSVSSVADPDAGVDETLRARAIYAAGVRTQVLDGIFERPAIAGLLASGESAPVDVENPWSSTLLKAFAGQYASAITESGLAETLAAGEAINPIAVEELVLGAAERTSAEYASLSGSWRGLQERVYGGNALSFADAVVV